MELTVKQPIKFLGSRLVREPDCSERPIIKTPEDAAFFLHERIAEGLDREVFGVITLSPAGHVHHCEIVSIGTIESALADIPCGVAAFFFVTHCHAVSEQVSCFSEIIIC